MALRLVLSSAGLVLLVVLSASSQRSSYNPASQHAFKQSENFIDFSFKQLNPQDRDYGCEIDEARKLLIAETVKKVDSWAVLSALIFLVIAFLLLIHAHREQNRREIIAAGLLAQYHNAWLDARVHAEHLTRFHDEARHTNSSIERPSSVQPQPAEIQHAMPVQSDSNPDKQREWVSTDGRGSGRGNENDRTTPVREGSREIQSHTPSEVGLLAQIRTLQQQLSGSYEREKNLQKELSRAHRRLQSATAKPAPTG